MAERLGFLLRKDLPRESDLPSSVKGLMARRCPCPGRAGECRPLIWSEEARVATSPG